MDREQIFNRRNDLNAELMSLETSFSGGTQIGDYRILKIYEARLKGQEDPYDLEDLIKKRNLARNRINQIQNELKTLVD